MFKVIIAGGRSFNDYSSLKKLADKVLVEKKKNNTIEIVSGGANGADKLGEKYAKENGFEIKRFNPDWDRFGKSAGPKRNKQTAEYADALIGMVTAKVLPI
jgi:ABC-type enterochelin transport system substrate-binding protein